MRSLTRLAPLPIMLLAGCSPAAPLDTHQVSGYPLDRSLDALIAQRDMDVVLLTGPVIAEPAVDLAGTSPAPQAQGMPSIVTPGHAAVRQVLRGDAPRTINVVIAGGVVGNERVVAGDEIAPSPADLSQAATLLWVGEWVTVPGRGRSLEPWFVYSVGEDGVATSLLSSAGDEAYPTFRLADFEKELSG